MIYRQDDFQRAHHMVPIPRCLFHSRKGSIAHIADSESLHVTVAVVRKINAALAFASLYSMKISFGCRTQGIWEESKMVKFLMRKNIQIFLPLFS